MIKSWKTLCIYQAYIRIADFELNMNKIFYEASYHTFKRTVYGTRTSVIKKNIHCNYNSRGLKVWRQILNRMTNQDDDTVPPNLGILKRN